LKRSHSEREDSSSPFPVHSNYSPAKTVPISDEVSHMKKRRGEKWVEKAPICEERRQGRPPDNKELMLTAKFTEGCVPMSRSVFRCFNGHVREDEEISHLIERGDKEYVEVHYWANRTENPYKSKAQREKLTSDQLEEFKRNARSNPLSCVAYS
jgi:hypothetical protein